MPGREEEFKNFTKEAKARLRLELPIVQEHITARGIKYEMLEHFEWGYVPHDEGNGCHKNRLHRYWTVEELMWMKDIQQFLGLGSS